jgi:hypothetical protein
LIVVVPTFEMGDFKGVLVELGVLISSVEFLVAVSVLCEGDGDLDCDAVQNGDGEVDWDGDGDGDGDREEIGIREGVILGGVLFD